MIANHTLARAGTERLQRSVEGLASGAYCITVMRQNDDEISAQVANGDGKSYPVTLTAVRSFYSEAQTILGYVSAVADMCNEAEKKGEDTVYALHQLLGELADEGRRRLERAQEALEIVWEREEQAKKATHARKEGV